jgi:hypothetical protein
VSVVWASGVTLTVEVAFEAGPLDTYQLDEDGVIILDEDDLPLDIEWTDISQYVRDITIDAGRSSEFTTFSPSTCQIVLDNNARQFDPLYASGPYYGDLDPMKRIRVIAEYASVEYPMFTGYVLGWPSEVDGFVDEFVTVQCVDGSRFLENSPLAQSAYESAVMTDAPIAYWPFQEDVAADSDYVDIASGLTFSSAGEWGAGPTSNVLTVAASITPTAAQTTITDGSARLSRSSGLGAVPLSVDAWMYVGPDYGGRTYTLEWRAGNDGSTADGVQVGVSDVSGRWFVGFSNVALNKYVAIGTEPGSVFAHAGWHHVAVTADTSTVTLYVDGVSVGTASTSAGTTGLGGTFISCRTDNVYVSPASPGVGTDAIAHCAAYPTTLSASRIQEHYLAGVAAFGHPFGERGGARVGRVLDEIGWPSADRDLSTGDTVHGKYRPERSSALTYLRDVETAENGYLFLDASGKVTLRDRTWQWTRTSSGTFSDDGAGLPYSDITIDANNVDVIRNVVSNTYGPNDAYLKVKDDDSVRYYGPSQETLSTPTLESSQTARALAEYWLRIAKDPSTRVIGLETKPRTNPATMFPVVLALELGDRITVERTPKGLGSQIVQDVVVQGYSHTISRELEWITSLYLSPAPALATDVPYLIVGDATYGQIGAVAGNKIPF